MAFDAFQRELSDIVKAGDFPVEFRVAPIAELLLARIDDLNISDGTVRMAFATDERFVHGGGVVQGGIVACMLDFAMAVLLLAQIDDGQSIATTNLSTEFLRPAPPGDFFVEAEVVRKGRSVSFCRGNLYDTARQHVAAASATNLVIQMPA